MSRRTAKERAALDSYRLWAGPSAQARERMLQGLSRRAARGELPDSIVPTPPRRLVQPGGWRVRPLRLWAGAGLGALIGLGAWLWLETRRTEPAPAAPAAAMEPLQPLAAERAPDPPVAPRDLAAEPIARAQPSAPAPRARIKSTKRALPAAAPEAAASKHHELDEELRLMRAAYDALRDGRPERALERVAEHASRFPDGELAESREVTRMLALCQTGEVAAARSAAAAFLSRAPHSAYAARVRRICSEPSQP